MEVLASKIRLNSRIKGIKVDEEEFKLKTYANDVVLTILTPLYFVALCNRTN